MIILQLVVVFLCIPYGKGVYLTFYGSLSHPGQARFSHDNRPPFFLLAAWEVIFDF
jgi:hypothetical protein